MAARLRPRTGMTLIELLVAMSILAVLGALVTVGVMSWIGSQQRRNTESALTAVNLALQKHWAAVVSDAKKEPVPQVVVDLTKPSAMSTQTDAELARIIWIKIRLMEAFPVNFGELNNPYSTGTVLGTYIPQPSSGKPATPRRYMNGYVEAIKNRVTAKADPTTESAACLLLALSTNKGGITHNPDLLKPYVGDTNGDQVQELVDGWGQPLRFYRFPTGNSDLQEAGYKLVNPAQYAEIQNIPQVPYPPPSPWTPPVRANPAPNTRLDPLDPKGKLGSWPGTNGTTIYDALIHQRIDTSTNYNFAWYAVPVVVSVGPNGKLGLNGNNSAEGGATPYQDMSVTNSTDAADNIYSYKLK